MDRDLQFVDSVSTDHHRIAPVCLFQYIDPAVLMESDVLLYNDKINIEKNEKCNVYQMKNVNSTTQVC